MASPVLFQKNHHLCEVFYMIGNSVHNVKLRKEMYVLLRNIIKNRDKRISSLESVNINYIIQHPECIKTPYGLQLWNKIVKAVQAFENGKEYEETTSAANSCASSCESSNAVAAVETSEQIVINLQKPIKNITIVIAGENVELIKILNKCKGTALHLECC